MTRIPYEVLALEVDKLYPPHYVLKSDETLEEHLLLIETLIEASGWTTEEYLQEYVHRGLKEYLPPDIKEQN